MDNTISFVRPQLWQKNKKHLGWLENFCYCIKAKKARVTKKILYRSSFFNCAHMEKKKCNFFPRVKWCICCVCSIYSCIYQNSHPDRHAEQSNQPHACNRIMFAVRKTVCVQERLECNNEVQLLWKSSFKIDLECNDMESSSMPQWRLKFPKFISAYFWVVHTWFHFTLK